MIHSGAFKKNLKHFNRGSFF